MDYIINWRYEYILVWINLCDKNIVIINYNINWRVDYVNK
jgi:hypothetical protein